jgi:hypothetical protein
MAKGFDWKSKQYYLLTSVEIGAILGSDGNAKFVREPYGGGARTRRELPFCMWIWHILTLAIWQAMRARRVAQAHLLRRGAPVCR